MADSRHILPRLSGSQSANGKRLLPYVSNFENLRRPGVQTTVAEEARADAQTIEYLSGTLR